MLIGAFVIVFLVLGASSLPVNIIQIGLRNHQFGREQAPMVAVVYFPLLFLTWIFQIYMTVGQMIFLLKIARGQPVGFGDLFRGGRYLLRAIGNGLLFGLMLGIGFMLLIVPGVIAALMFWPYIFVLVDTNARGIECLSRAREITPHTWGTMILLWLTMFALAFLGALACGVGMLFTIPLSMLLFAVAYCRMTGQPTASV
jgi:uncharacterized membrane protein